MSSVTAVRTPPAAIGRLAQGGLSIEQGMLAVAYAGGWPMRTSAGFLVAVPAADQREMFLLSEHDGWRPVPMRREGGLWVGTIPGPPGAEIRYLVRSGQGAPYADPWARHHRYDANGDVNLTAARGAHLERWPLFRGNGLAPRSLHVWVPRGRPTHHLYAHDGQNLFDPGAPWGGWHLQEQVGPNTLVVGIDHGGERRLGELTPFPGRVDGRITGGQGAAYAKFVAEQVIPFIEDRYGAPDVRGTMGASLGGLMALYQAVDRPGLFDFAASLSGTVEWGRGGDRSLFSLLDSPARCGNCVLYLDSGEDNYQENRDLAGHLAAHGFSYDNDLWHWYDRGAEHTEAAWRRRLHRPIRLFERLPATSRT